MSAAMESASNTLAAEGMREDDPFAATPANLRHTKRYSMFNSQLLAQNSNGSPARAKGIVEAHLAETDRRLREASELGTVLVQQRKDLSERLKEIEAQQDDDEIGPELRKKLEEIENEFNEVGRQSTRAFVAKSRVSSNENADPTASPAVFFSEAQHSPSKVSVPTRKQRNHKGSRENDIKFAADLSSSLIEQIRQLQAALNEKNDALKSALLHNSQLESESEGRLQKVRALSESEQRYKDENWNLETQLHDLTNDTREAATREQRLNISINAANSEKNALEQELEELKQIHTKLNDDHAAMRKQTESQLNVLHRNLASEEAERTTLERRVEELFSQNQELAKGLAVRMRSKDQASSDEDEDNLEQVAINAESPEHSPPPSPSKGTPRHGHLESETLKSSLHHAHRMIQNLKNNIHREKTEKIELKRMLQEARDEVEARRGEGGHQNGGKKRKPATQQDVFKKPPRPDRLGGARGPREEIISDVDWEDQEGPDSPIRSQGARKSIVIPSSSSNFRAKDQQSRNETEAIETTEESSDAFNTANELDGTTTETDAFHTGAESLDGNSSSGDLTETEGANNNLFNNRTSATRPHHFAKMRSSGRASFISTASTSGDDDDSAEAKTPVETHARYKVRVSKGSNRRSMRESSETPKMDTPGSARDSPASFVSNQSQGNAGPSLLAELGQLNDDNDGDGSFFEGTPSQASTTSRNVTPALPSRRIRSIMSNERQATPVKADMVEAGTMTEPWMPDNAQATLPRLNNTSGDEDAALRADQITRGFVLHKGTNERDGARRIASASSSGSWNRSFALHPDSGFSSADNSLIAAGNEPANIEFSDPNEETVKLSSGAIAEMTNQTAPISLSFSAIGVQYTEPVEEKETPDAVNQLKDAPVPSSFSEVETTNPSSITKADVVNLSFSPVLSENVIPVEPPNADDSMLSSTAPYLASDDRQSTYESGTGLYLSISRYSDAGNSFISQERLSTSDTRSMAHTRDIGTPSQIESHQTSRDDEYGQYASVQSTGETPIAVPELSVTDEGTQTQVLAEDIDKVLTARSTQVTSDATQTSPTIAPKAFLHGAKRSFDSTNSTDPMYKTPRRPTSSGSMRRSGTPPPLPSDHKKVIAAANASKASSGAAAVVGSMGPPLMPASAYRRNSHPRPRTPSFSNGHAHVTTPKGSSTPRPRAGTTRSEASPITRRSSVSSFASELDERFNLSKTPMLPEGLEVSNTDPRMIQAITQTMIGEFLWKYTRKAGRSDISTKRHRRFFWVHPYTRTLYWSEQDPATAGKSQLKAKSVAIQAVRVITDDNPMPPGIYRKSLVVLTPGRSVVFTCPTSRKHETWFNALSFLLLRTVPERESDMNNITAADVEEFNPQFNRSSSRTAGGARASLASYASRTPHVPSPQRSAAGRGSSLRHTNNSQQTNRSEDQHQHDEYATPRAGNALHTQSDIGGGGGSTSGRFSSLSGMFKSSSSIRNSISSRRSKKFHIPADDQVTSRDVRRDSVEDFKKVIERQEREMGGVENVRACCEGMFIYASLYMII